MAKLSEKYLEYDEEQLVGAFEAVLFASGEPVEIDLTGIFSDPNNDPLKYKITENGTVIERAYEEEKYTRTYGEAGDLYICS